MLVFVPGDEFNFLVCRITQGEGNGGRSLVAGRWTISDSARTRGDETEVFVKVEDRVEDLLDPVI